ncbi:MULTISPECIES: hypothetical protein [Sphingobium]|jgi:hypothetical protein|uniref:hypothetical protein n=1 Tax=Sphingobium TaxID=165695 RepID=UPI001DFF9146|nr:hypothetical protein [Sphingobium sp. CFD-2]MDF0545228.1 hypothetical protein [Sphingobium arseniciresistens]TNE43756.1 MAG: hypothetical protein EP345_03740 [Sphingomonadales bacterium]
MSADAYVQLRTYVVTVEFFSDAECYASELYTIDAVNWYRAEQTAIAMSDSSTYYHPAIPALSRAAVAQATDV